MNKKALTVLVISLSMICAPLAHAQTSTNTYVEVPADASSITYNDAANCADAQSIVTSAQNAANERISDVNKVVKDIGTETRNRRACIENLMKLLTFAIPTFPSLTAIITQLVQAFIQNLIGKACAAATSAINGAISQVNGQINNVNGVINGVTQPITNLQNQANSSMNGSMKVFPDPASVVRQEIARPAQSAPVPAVTKSAPAASGWESISCKIFGGC